MVAPLRSVYEGSVHSNLLCFCPFVGESIPGLFSLARLVHSKTSCHMVALSFEAGIHYLNFGNIYETVEFNGWKMMPSAVANLDYLAISANELDLGQKLVRLFAL